jgi:hypothetical protein
MKMKKRNENNKVKFCPLLDKQCIQEECAIYHEQFKKCEINILTYNLWLVGDRLKPEPTV